MGCSGVVHRALAFDQGRGADASMNAVVQAAEVLLMMRPEGEASSDFQEYTLVALFALAAHLAGGVAAETASLPAMARYYKQDLEVLQQVCR